MLAFGAAAGLAFAGAALAADPGTWQPHQTTFDYLGISPTYSCEGLKDDLIYLLQKSGARLDGQVNPQPCTGGFGAPSKLLSARLKFSTLQPAGEGSETAAATVPGSWRQVTISPQTSGFVLRGADCELVEEFRDKILPLLPVRNIQSNLHCIPHQSTGFQYGLSFQVFAPSGAKQP
ncbi:MAG TPA: hypothetical protein VHX52_02755 [Steroidobacteraceae bacterium]|nr:hypothetical protein [Steroidobacteraceae bacterium]